MCFESAISLFGAGVQEDQAQVAQGCLPQQIATQSVFSSGPVWPMLRQSINGGGPVWPMQSVFSSGPAEPTLRRSINGGGPRRSRVVNATAIYQRRRSRVANAICIQRRQRNQLTWSQAGVQSTILVGNLLRGNQLAWSQEDSRTEDPRTQDKKNPRQVGYQKGTVRKPIYTRTRMSCKLSIDKDAQFQDTKRSTEKSGVLLSKKGGVTGLAALRCQIRQGA